MSNINDPKAEKFIAILNLSDTLQYFLDAHEEINGCIDPCECDGCKAARFHLERIGRSDAPKNNEEQSEDAALPDGRWIPGSIPPATVLNGDGWYESVRMLAILDSGEYGVVHYEHEDNDEGWKQWYCHIQGDAVNVAYYLPLPTPPTN